MPKFGSIVLVPFPFTDLSATKVRPALVLSREQNKGDDVILCFISSNTSNTPTSCVQISFNDECFSESGLKTASVLRFDKIATLHKSLLFGEIGTLPDSFLQMHKNKFYDLFGF